MQPTDFEPEKQESRIPKWLKFAGAAIAAGLFGQLFGFVGIAVVALIVFVYYVYAGYVGA